MSFECPHCGSKEWRGSIKSAASHIASRWDWGWLEHVLPRNISPSDVDGVLFGGVALDNGGRRILFIETKGVGVPVKRGQMSFFLALSDRPGQSVVILWGEPDHPQEAQWIQNGVVGERRPCSRDDVSKWVRFHYKDCPFLVEP